MRVGDRTIVARNVDEHEQATVVEQATRQEHETRGGAAPRHTEAESPAATQVRQHSSRELAPTAVLAAVRDALLAPERIGPVVSDGQVARALQLLRAAVRGRDPDGEAEVLVEDRQVMLEQGIAAVSPVLTQLSYAGGAETAQFYAEVQVAVVALRARFAAIAARQAGGGFRKRKRVVAKPASPDAADGCAAAATDVALDGEEEAEVDVTPASAEPVATIVGVAAVRAAVEVTAAAPPEGLAAIEKTAPTLAAVDVTAAFAPPLAASADVAAAAPKAAADRNAKPPPPSKPRRAKR